MRRFTSLFCLSFAFCFSSTLFGQGTFQIIAQKGEVPPRGIGNFDTFRVPVLNNWGEVAFLARIEGTPNGNLDDYGAFFFDGNSIADIVQEGDPAPDGNGIFSGLGGIDSVAMNDLSDVVWYGKFANTNGGTATEGIFKWDGSGISRIVRQGDPAPSGGGNFNFIGKYHIALNSVGEVAFTTSLINTSRNSGVYRSDGTTLTEIARQGDSMPDGEGEFRGGTDLYLNLQDTGHVAFTGFIDVSFAIDGGVFRGNGSEFSIVAREDHPAPGGNGEFDRFDSVASNEQGQVVFEAAIRNPRGCGIFLRDGFSLTSITRSGDFEHATGFPFIDFDRPAINNLGHVVFRASVVNRSNELESLLMLFDGSSLTTIARQGDPAPDGNGIFDEFRDPLINDRGEIFFSTTYTNTSERRAILCYSQGKGLRQIIRSGDQIGGIVVGVFVLFINNNLDGPEHEANSINDLGQVAFVFASSSGAQVLAVYTPDGGPVCAGNGTLIEGVGQINDFISTCGSDDTRWAAHGATFAFSVTDPVVQFELTATAPAGFGGSTISVDLEASKANNNAALILRAQLFNFVTDSYVALPGILTLTTADQVKNYTLPSGSTPADFIEPGTNQVWLLLQTTQTSGVPNVRTQLDEVLFNFQ